MVVCYYFQHQNRFMRFISCYLSEELMDFIPLGVHNRIKTDYEYCKIYIQMSPDGANYL